MTSNHSSLDAAATERKARLAKLKSLKRKQPATEEDTQSIQHATDGPFHEPPAALLTLGSKDTNQHLSGRNYDVETRGPKLGFESAPSGDQETLEDRAAAIAQKTKDKEVSEGKEDKPLDLFTLQPKKPNWDLKRDLNKKLEILNVRMENAIARMVRERIAGAQKTAKSKAGNGAVTASEGGEEMGMEGVALVEGVKLREREEEEDERREREDEEMQ